MGIALKEVLENEVISADIMNLLPKICKCGANIEFSDSLRELRCTDKKCKQFTISRIYKFIDNLNITLSDIDIEDVVKKLKIISPYQLLLLPKAFKEDNNKIIEALKSLF